MIYPAASNSYTLADSAVTACAIHIDYQQKWCQHPPLSETKTHSEWFWFNSINMNTNAWAGIQWLYEKGIIDKGTQALGNVVIQRSQQRRS